MKNWASFFVVYLFVISCKPNRNIPDVSNIPVTLETVRFEQMFFSIDTNKLDQSLEDLHHKIPGFTQDFIFNILGCSPVGDSAIKDIKKFSLSYRRIYDSSRRTFQNFEPIEKNIKEGLQRVKFYFPDYKLPKKIITFIGPMNSYGNILTQDALGIGLQLYLGKDFSVYTSQEGRELYPDFISRRFEASYIPTNCIKNIIDDIYPSKYNSKSFIEQMVEQGKRLYVLDQLMPYTPDSIKIGYTNAQLQWCYKNEKNIWGFLIESKLLFSTDYSAIAPYLTDGPKTESLGDGTPGNIGLFCGWQIVKKWMDKNPKTQLYLLMSKNSKELFDESKYKP